MNHSIINGIKLCYRDEGSGPPLVFLHAFPLNQGMWDDQFVAFSKKYRVIAPDFRGFGQSQLGEQATTIESFADDLAGLLDHLSIEKAVFCGLSMGGYAAFAFLRKYPGRIAGLILADTRASADGEESRRARHDTAATVRREGPAALIPGMSQKLLGKTTLASRPDIVERINSIILTGNAEGIAQALIAMAARPDSSDMLGGISFPTLVISGEEDTIIPHEEATGLSRAIPGSEIVIIPAAGHLPNIEKIEEFNDTVTRFLTSASIGDEWV